MTNNQSMALVPQGFAELDQLSEKLSKSALLPEALRNKPQDVMFQIMTGAELGFGPTASIRGVHIIAGKPTLSADAMVALCLRSGHCEYFVQTESSATSVTFETKRKSAPVVQRTTWTWEDAKRAGLNTKENWRLYPRQMLASRAKAELARVAYSDLLFGVYDPDELESTPIRATVEHRDPKPANDAIDAEIVEPVADDLLERVTHAESSAVLEALKAQCSALVGTRRTTIREAFTARQRFLEAK